MDLFTLQVEESKLHPNFKAVMGHGISSGNISIRRKLEKERNTLQSWCVGFPDHDKKFVKEFQTTFNSSFWEIYLYKLFSVASRALF